MWNGNDRTVRTTVQESPRGAESARDTGDVLLSKAMVQACHADPVGVPLTRSSRDPHNPKVADRCTSIARRRPSRKHIWLPPFPRRGVGAARHQLRCAMPGPLPASPGSPDLRAQLDRLAHEYHATADVAAFRERLTKLIAGATPDALITAAESHRDEPEIVAPIYEMVVDSQPNNARALVILANAYWLQGRGPQAVGELATRAIAADPANRGAWHLWALSESDPRDRVRRWQQVSERFPQDTLAMAAVADNAASVAGAERDYQMLDFAIETYERLLDRTTDPSQREAVNTALAALRGWRF